MESSGNPLLDQYNRDGIVTPPLQRALELYRQKLPQIAPLGAAPPAEAQPSGPKPLTGPSQPAPSLTPMPGATGPAPLSTPAVPAPTPLSTHQGELNRLTAPPIESGPLAHTKADTGRSGIGQIHNPWLRSLATVGDVIGSGFFPRAAAAIPGTSLHHQGLVNMARTNVANDESQATAEANREHLHAESSALMNPQTKTEFEAWLKQNPNGKIEDFEKAKATGKNTPVTNAFEGWRAQNPNAPVEDWLKLQESTKQHNPSEYADFKTGYLKEHPQATSEDLAKAFSAARQAPQRTPENEYEDFKAGYLKEHPNSGMSELSKAYAKAHQAPPSADHGVTMIGPDNRVLRLEPGQMAPQGSMTPSGVNSMNVPTSQTRTMAETAPKVQELATRVGQLIDQQAKTLGPAASRWSEFMAGHVGAPNPEFTKLRTDVGLLQTALMRMHVGARGGEQMMEHFRNLIDVAKQSPENLKAALEEIQEYAKQVAAEGKRGGGSDKDGGLPGGVTIQDIDAEIARRKTKK